MWIIRHMNEFPSIRFMLMLVGFLSVCEVSYCADILGASEDPHVARRNLIKQFLLLEPSKAARFWPLYESYQRELDHFRQLRLDLLSSMGENYDNMSETDARHIIEERLRIERGRSELLIKTVEKMERVLTQRELARFLQIELKIKAFVEAGIEEEIPILQ